VTGPGTLAGSPVIRRRWLLGIAGFAVAWLVLLGPVATALFGPSGAAPTTDLQADRLVYEEVVKLVLVLGVAALAGWIGLWTLRTRTFPPAGMGVPLGISVNHGTGALVPGVGLLLAALLAVGFRVASLAVTLRLAELLRHVG